MRVLTEDAAREAGPGEQKLQRLKANNRLVNLTSNPRIWVMADIEIVCGNGWEKGRQRQKAKFANSGDPQPNPFERSKDDSATTKRLAKVAVALLEHVDKIRVLSEARIHHGRCGWQAIFQSLVSSRTATHEPSSTLPSTRPLQRTPTFGLINGAHPAILPDLVLHVSYKGR